jgi:menaquinone-dependent protoporphyrinogen oxidase
MPQILLLYSSVYGHSRRISERLQAHLAQRGIAATVAAVTDAGPDPAAFDAVVIGASIRHGKHQPTVMDYIGRHLALLQARPSAFFSVNLVARKPTRNTRETNPYLRRFMAASPWRPALQGVFAGELDYARYGPLDRRLMQFVMWLNKGPTDPATQVAFTDWQAVERFAAEVAALVAPGAAGPAAAAPGARAATP